MSQEDWDKMKALFQAAIEIPECDQAAFCEAQCDSDATREELKLLLKAHNEAEADFLKSPLEATDEVPTFDPLIGQQIDNFQIVGRIGAGGMGVVYEATQENPSRRVAVKLLKPGSNSTRMLWRLQHESEILARLHHPGIAHVYASGIADIGHGQQPWFAMELVEGMPLHRHVVQHQLTIKRKLLLFLQIADAVQHAHERGVIHRDLKPANIVISSNSDAVDRPDTECQPKILDFGIARIVEESGDSDHTRFTEVGEIAGTISYMSPERFANDVRLVDHRCDVYALGVVGFELLTGTLPIDVRNSSILEAVRAVEQQSPTNLGNVVPSLRGDVEVIIGKALEKDPDRRYQSARELADDIRRYMNDQPILARPASAAYRLRKFVSRHRTIVGGIAATITALVFGLVLYAAEARQARTEAAKSQYEADKAMAINNFMTNDFFTMLLTAAQTDPAGERLPVSEMINTAAAGIPEMFSDRPAIEAAVRNEVGTINYNIGSLDQAAEQYEAALQLWESELGPEHPDTLKAVNNLGQVSLRLGLGDDAERLYRRALQGRLNALGESNPYTLATMNNLAELLRGTGRIDQAEVMLRRAYQLQLATSGPDDKQTLIVMANLGSLLAQREHYAEAADLHRTVFETMRRTLGNKHITTLHAQRELSLSLYRLEEFQQAKDLLMPVLQSFEQTFGAAHGETIMARRLMSRIERKSGNIATARDHLNAALTAAKTNSKQLGPLIPKIERDLERLEE